MEPLSVTIIAMNEEDRIGRAIRSAAFADEVLVVDSGSSDDTVAVAEAFGARVIQADWPGYRQQKNRAAAWARNDWVLGLDADEALNPTLIASIQAALVHPSAKGFEIDRQGFWMGEEIRYGTWRPDRSIRLYDRRSGSWEGGSVHERVRVDGPVTRLEGDILHYPYRNIGEQVDDLYRYALLFVRDSMAAGRRAAFWDVMLRPCAHFFKAVVLRRGVLDGVRGWLLAGIGAMGVMLKWGLLYLAQRQS
jgi:glycosyltransferase involved in cell wall biosynthesis